MAKSWCVLPGWAFAALSLSSISLSTRARADLGPEETQLELAAKVTVKVTVRREGWTRVTQPELVATGLDPNVDPAQLRLLTDGIEQPLNVTGNGDATFDPDEAIEFYGRGRDTLWTDARTYWLTEGGAGQRIPKVVYPRGDAPPSTFLATSRAQERRIYYAPLRNGDASNFFSASVDDKGTTETLPLHHLTGSPSGTLRFSVQGVTTGDHVVSVALNDAPAGTCAYTGQVLQLCTLPVTGMVEGDNRVTLTSTGVAPDLSLLDSVALDYAHAYTADANALTLTAPPLVRLAIDGFSSAAVRVIDLTDANAPFELAVSVAFDGATYVVSLDTPSSTDPRTLYAFADEAVGKADSVAANRPSAWSEPQDGELVILSHAQFIDSMRPLVERRTQEGWSVALIDLQDVYDEFGFGEKTVFAVRDFLQYARDHWRVPPRFVLLVGDATFDPRNFLGQGSFDFAPTKLIDTQELETASDDWFADWNDDGVPELALGRLSVRTATEASTVVRKILAFDGVAGRARGGLFVADQNSDGLDFEKSSAQSAAVVDDRIPVQTLFRGQLGAGAEAALLTKLNQGPFLVNYFGHGSVEVWDGLFSSADAEALTNARSSVYVSMNCLNGFFQDLYTESLAEALLKAPSGGAVAVWASSTLTSFEPQATLNREFLSRLTHTSLGEAATAAKQAITDPDARRTWILFGDPTLFGTPQGAASDAAAGGDDGAAPGDARNQADAAVSDGPPNDRKPDASSSATSDRGCGCGAAGAARPSSPLSGLALLGLLVFRRRRARSKRKNLPSA
jgi:MYXO-CTERM domain-containing protein